MYVYADFNYSYSGQSFLSMVNISRNLYWSTGAYNFTPSQNSAEWIDERPQRNCRGGVYQPDLLADFQPSTQWSSASAASHTVNGGAATSISGLRNEDITMVDPYSAVNPLAYPSSLTGGGQAFTDTFNYPGTYFNC